MVKDIRVVTELRSVPSLPYYRRQYFFIGTHNGIFHSDEVVAIAILCLLRQKEQYDYKQISIVRTRDAETLKLCDICVDIGGGLYDHHQPGFDFSRENDIPYASAGLVWKEFGEELMEKYMSNYFPEEISSSHSKGLSKKFDEEIISLVDCEDNGIKADKHCFNFIDSYLPLWNDTDSTNFHNQFEKVLPIVISILDQEIIKTIGTYMAERTLLNRRKKSKYCSDNILEIPSQTIPWLETVCDIINPSVSSSYVINFVIFPYPAGGWAAQCVPPSLEEKFKQRISFPKDWAGQTDNLPAISTVEDATFCHNGCFFARAKTKEGIVKMCKLAMEQYHSK